MKKEKLTINNYKRKAYDSEKKKKKSKTTQNRT